MFTWCLLGAGGYTPEQLAEIQQKASTAAAAAAEDEESAIAAADNKPNRPPQQQAKAKVRPAEAAGVPLGALCVSVGGEGVVGKAAIVRHIRRLQKAQRAVAAGGGGGGGGQPTVEFVFQAPRAALGALRQELEVRGTQAAPPYHATSCHIIHYRVRSYEN